MEGRAWPSSRNIPLASRPSGEGTDSIRPDTIVRTEARNGSDGWLAITKKKAKRPCAKSNYPRAAMCHNLAGSPADGIEPVSNRPGHHCRDAQHVSGDSAGCRAWKLGRTSRWWVVGLAGHDCGNRRLVGACTIVELTWGRMWPRLRCCPSRTRAAAGTKKVKNHQCDGLTEELIEVAAPHSTSACSSAIHGFFLSGQNVDIRKVLGAYATSWREASAESPTGRVGGSQSGWKTPTMAISCGRRVLTGNLTISSRFRIRFRRPSWSVPGEKLTGAAILKRGAAAVSGGLSGFSARALFFESAYGRKYTDIHSLLQPRVASDPSLALAYSGLAG